MGSNPTSNRKLCHVGINFLSSSTSTFLSSCGDVTIINDKNHLWSNVPCLQTSIYKALWLEYKFIDLSLKVALVYQSLFTDPTLQVPSLTVSHYSSLLIRKMEKNQNSIWLIFSVYSVWFVIMLSTK